MSKTNDGGPAFPSEEWHYNENVKHSDKGSHEFAGMWPGMSLRDWFAGQALNGALAQGGDESTYTPTDRDEDFEEADGKGTHTRSESGFWHQVYSGKGTHNRRASHTFDYRLAREMYAIADAMLARHAEPAPGARPAHARGGGVVPAGRRDRCEEAHPMTVRHPLSERWWSARADHPIPQHFICADAMSHAMDMLYATLIDIANSSGPQDQRRNFHEGCTPEDAFRNGIATARFEAAEKARFVILGFEEGDP